MNDITLAQELEIMKQLEEIDTPTVTNVVATYPGNPNCLGLYSPWEDNWYTDQNLKAMFPELGARCGYAVTCVYGLPAESGDKTLKDVLEAFDNSPKPVILTIKQDFPEKIRDKVGLCGGNMTTAFKAMGCVGVISDGPSRDLDEVRALNVQYMLTGVTAGHGPMAVKEVNIPVSICGMDVIPGEIIHMDKNGAVKFPQNKLREVLDCCRRFLEDESEKQSCMAASTDPFDIARYMKGDYK